MPLIALSAAYGAGGDVVGPRLAERLGVPFLDRAIPLKVAERLDVSVDDAAVHDDVLRVRLDGPVERRVTQAMRVGGVDQPTAERVILSALGSLERSA